MNKKKIFAVSVILCISLLLTLPAFAATNISVIVDNSPVVFDTQPFIENNRTLVPLRAIAEAAGIEVDYDATTRIVTLTKIERLLKIPLDSVDPYIDGKTHIVKLTLDSDIATIDGSEIKLDVAARSVGGRTVVPLRFVSEAMDMDVIWSSTGIGILNGNPGVLINTRLRGSAPIAGTAVFSTASPDIISIKDDKGNFVTLGMDVTEMQKSLGDPALAWGRGIPAPQMLYEYGNNISSINDIGNAYAEIGCTLGTVTVIQLGPGSGFELKTGMGVAVGDSASIIAKVYKGSESYLKDYDSNGRIILAYAGNTLKYAVSTGSAFLSDYSESDITHVLDFVISNDKIEAIAIADVVSARELFNSAI